MMALTGRSFSLPEDMPSAGATTFDYRARFELQVSTSDVLDTWQVDPKGAACSNSRPQPGAKTLEGLEGGGGGRWVGRSAAGVPRGGSVGRRRRKKFLPFLRGYFFLTLCVYTQNTQNFVEKSKMFEKHRKNLDP